MSTASFATGSVQVVVVTTEVVEVTVVVISSHSYESHGHPAGQFSLIINVIIYRAYNKLTSQGQSAVRPLN